MKILITGAAGLYGVHLTDLLCRQRWVRQVIGVDDFSRKFFTKDPFIKSPSFDRKFKLLKMKYQGLTVKQIDDYDFDIIVHQNEISGADRKTN